MEWIGWLLALATVVLFGSWAVPSKMVEASTEIKSFWLTIGHLVFAIVLYWSSSGPWSLELSTGSLLAGIIWGIGINAGYLGIRELGITRAISIWVPIVIITSTLWGLYYFNEIQAYTSSELLSLGLGIGLLSAAALTIVRSSRAETTSGNITLGILGAVVLGLLHGSYYVPLQQSPLSMQQLFVPLSMGMVVVTSLMLMAKKTPPVASPNSVVRMALSGVILGMGNYTAMLTIMYLGVSRGYPLTQMAIVVNALWGIFYFREITRGRELVQVTIGIVILILGALVLNSVGE